MPVLISIVLAIVIAGASYIYLSTPAPDAEPENTEITRSPESEAAESEELTPDEDTEETTATTDVDTPESRYTASAGYQTPARTQQEIAVTLTVDEAGIVTEADVVYDNSPGYSNPNQERFDGAYVSEVVGKSLDEISLSRVGGASLTSGAFNEAVGKIATEANS